MCDGFPNARSKWPTVQIRILLDRSLAGFPPFLLGHLRCPVPARDASLHRRSRPGLFTLGDFLLRRLGLRRGRQPLSRAAQGAGKEKGKHGRSLCQCQTGNARDDIHSRTHIRHHRMAALGRNPGRAFGLSIVNARTSDQRRHWPQRSIPVLRDARAASGFQILEFGVCTDGSDPKTAETMP